MKRPLFMLWIGLVLGELCAYTMAAKGVIIPACLLLAVVTVGIDKPFFWKKYRMLLLLLGISIFLGEIRWSIEDRKIEETETMMNSFYGEKLKLYGKIYDIKDQDADSCRIILQNPRIYYENTKYLLSGKLLLYGRMNSVPDQNNIMPGDRISLEGKISFPQAVRNPGEFDRKSYDLAAGIYGEGTFTKWSLRYRPPYSLQRKISSLKMRMEEAFMKNLREEDAALLCAMVLGDKSNLSREERNLYEENGVMHLLAVSGLHVSIVGGQIYRFLRKRGHTYLFSSLAGAVLLLFYAAMAGMGSSVIRASIMYIVYLLGEYSGRSYDMLSSMSLSASLMLLEAPCRLFQGGFIISFSSILAIGCFLPFVKERFAWKERERKKKQAIYETVKEQIREGMISSLLIYALTAPLTMYFYYENCPYSVFLNLLVIPCMTPLMISAISSGSYQLIFFFLWEKSCILTDCLILLWKLITIPALLILRIYHILFCLCRKIPGSFILTGRPALREIFLLYLMEGLVFCLIYALTKRKKTLIKGATVLCLLCIFAISLSKNNKILDICMLDVGQGDCILLRLPTKETILIDAGSTSRQNIYDNVLKPALDYHGISSLDYVMISHFDEDHISGIREMLQAAYPVKHLLIGRTDGNQEDPMRREILNLAGEAGVTIHIMEKGSLVNIGELVLRCLHPEKNENYGDRNSQSLVFLLQYKRFRALFPGDLGMDQEEKLLEEIRSPITLLKVGHHGSRYSTGEDLLDRMKATYAILSAGEHNRYGHPHKELIQRLKSHNIMVYQTRKKGAICLSNDGDKGEIYYWQDRHDILR